MVYNGEKSMNQTNENVKEGRRTNKNILCEILSGSNQTLYPSLINYNKHLWAKPPGEGGFH